MDVRVRGYDNVFLDGGLCPAAECHVDGVESRNRTMPWMIMRSPREKQGKRKKKKTRAGRKSDMYLIIAQKTAPEKITGITKCKETSENRC